MGAFTMVIDGINTEDCLMVSPPVVTVGKEPGVLWCRQRRDEHPQLVFKSLSSESKTLDRGEINEPSITSSASGEIIALWSKLEPEGSFRIYASFPESVSSTPFALSASPATCPASAISEDGRILAVWCRNHKENQIIEGIMGPGWGRVFPINTGRWSSRPAVAAVRRAGFVVIWDEIAPEGGSVWGATINRNGKNIRKMEIFARRKPTERYLFADIVSLGELCLVVAVRVEDVTGYHGVVDQHREISAALYNPLSGLIEHLPSPATLDHGLLCDPSVPTGVWGYLGRRIRPKLIDNGHLYYERKETHDGFTTRTNGVLCVRKLDLRTSSWGEEKIPHRGGLAYSLAIDPRSRFWIAYRKIHHGDDFFPIFNGQTHQLLLESIDETEGRVSKEKWLSPQSWKSIDMQEIRNRSKHSIVQVPQEALTLYWGDPHVHSAFSCDAEGEPDELLHYARDLACLDFVALTDNDDLYNCWLTGWESQRVRQLANIWTHDGRFVAVTGFEYTRPALEGFPPNHRTVLLPEPKGKLFRWTESVRPPLELQGSHQRSLEALSERSEEVNALLIAHHARWTLTDSKREIGVEAVSGWDTYIHNPKFIHQEWSSGRRIALIGGSDSHRRNPGLAGSLTGVWAQELSVKGILDAIRKRRTIVTQGRRPVLKLGLYDERGEHLFMGDHGCLEGRIVAHINAEVEEGSGDRIELIELKRGDAIIANWGSCDTNDGGRSFHAELELPVDIERPAYVYLRIRETGSDQRYPSNTAAARGPWSWSTPIWWEMKEP